MAERTGKYVKHGDVEEWEWDDDGATGPTLTGGYVVPEGEFDPRSAPPVEPSPYEKVMEAAGPSPGLQVVSEPAPEEPKTVKKAAESKK